MGRKSSNKGFPDGISGSLNNTMISACTQCEFQPDITYRFLLITLNNGEISWIMHTLHYEPRDGLFVLGINTRGFDQLVLELSDGGLARVLRTKVNLFQT